MAAVVLANLLAFVSLDLYATAYPLYLRELGWQAGPIGLAAGVVVAASILSRPWLGAVGDRWGPRSVLLLGLAACAAAAPLLAVAEGLAPVLALRALQGVGLAGVLLGSQHLAAEAAAGPGGGGRGRALAWQGTGDAAGLVVGPLLGELIYQGLGAPAFFALAAALPALALPAVLRIPGTGAARRPRARAEGPPATGFASPGGPPPGVRPAGWLGACTGLALGGVFGFFALRAAEAGLTRPAAFVVLLGLAMIAGRWVGGLGYDAGRGHAVPVLGLAAAGLGAWALVPQPGVVTAALGLLLIGFGFGSAQTALLAAVADLGGGARGRALGMLGSAVDLGTAVGAAGLAPVAAVAGTAGVFAAAGLVVLAGGVPAALRAGRWFPPAGRRSARADRAGAAGVPARGAAGTVAGAGVRDAPRGSAGG